jgi:thioredoxin-like negative regulator of GroEL
MGNRFVSYRQWEDRVIYKGKSGDMQRAERLIVAQDYPQAMQVLQEVYQASSENKLRAAAAHNLGYCYEIMGDLEQSKRWLTESFASTGSKKTQAYLARINQRISEQFLLEKQRDSK